MRSASFIACIHDFTSDSAVNLTKADSKYIKFEPTFLALTSIIAILPGLHVFYLKQTKDHFKGLEIPA